jgi:hypothetical protein
LIAQDKVLRCDFTGIRGQMGLHRTKRTYEISQTKRMDGIRQDQQDRGMRQDKKYRPEYAVHRGQMGLQYIVQDQDYRWDNTGGTDGIVQYCIQDQEER